MSTSTHCLVGREDKQGRVVWRRVEAIYTGRSRVSSPGKLEEPTSFPWLCSQEGATVSLLLCSRAHATYMSHTCLQTRSAEGFRGTGSSCLRKETCTATFCRTKGPGDCRVISGQRDVAPEPCSPGCFQEPAAPPDGSVVSGPGSFASESTRGRPAVPGAALHSPLQQCVPALCSAVPTGAQ